MKNVNQLIKRLKNRISIDRKRFILYTVLRFLVLVTMVRCFFLGEYENVALCILSLVLFLLPSAAEEGLGIRIPVFFESIIYLFIYSAWILGEIQNYYVLIPGWDTMLHTLNGFLCAAVGFSLVNLLNDRSEKVSLSPMYITIVAFCFSMTVGVVWEFFEFSMDQLFAFDMQKDSIVHTISSVKLDTAGTGVPVKVSDIVKTVIYTESGAPVTINGGYLDIGIIDTMNDLFVNLIGALAFSVIGYNYIDRHTASSIAPELQIRYETPEETAAIREQLAEADKLTYRQTMNREARELFRTRNGKKSSEEGAGEEKDQPGPESPGSRRSGAERSGAAAVSGSREKSGWRKNAKPGQRTLMTAWVAILLAFAGAIILYPVGNTFLNICFIVVKACMIGGILFFLFCPKQTRTRGLWTWTMASVAATLLTVYKWMLNTQISTADIRVYAAAILIDIGLPIVLWRMLRADSRT